MVKLCLFYSAYSLTILCDIKLVRGAKRLGTAVVGSLGVWQKMIIKHHLVVIFIWDFCGLDNKGEKYVSKTQLSRRGAAQ